MTTGNSDEQLIREFLETLKKEIVDAQSSKGLKASGKSAELLAVEASGNKGELIDGSGSFYFQEYGRASGKQPPFVPVGVIYEWLQYKKYGLNYANDKERKSLAFAISRKIGQQGTLTKRENRQTGVLTDILTNKRVDSFVKVLSEKYLSKVFSDVLDNFKGLE